MYFLESESLSLGESALYSVVCMLVVFSMLALLWGIVSLFKFLAPKKKAEVVNTPVQNNVAPVKSFKMEDIKDDDMMAAALIATIDYHNEIKKDVRVVSIKEL